MCGSTGGGSVFFHKPSGLYRKIYGCPETRVYESEDAIRWRPSPQPDARPVRRSEQSESRLDLSPHSLEGNVL